MKGKRLYLPTTNPLLAAGYPGTIGLKTGYTSEAGRCLIAVVRRGKRTLAAVLLRLAEPGRAGEAAAREGVQDELRRVEPAGLEPATSGAAALFQLSYGPVQW